jgi:hypothetical protein
MVFFSDHGFSSRRGSRKGVVFFTYDGYFTYGHHRLQTNSKEKFEFGTYAYMALFALLQV